MSTKIPCLHITLRLSLVWGALAWGALAACGDDSSADVGGGEVDGSTEVDGGVDGAEVDAGTLDVGADDAVGADVFDAGNDVGFDGGFVRLEGDVSHPMDDTLRLNQLQLEGTHNSYHLRPTSIYPEGIPSFFDYGFDSLDVQLEEQGVRKFEIDVHFDVGRGRWNVLHIPVIDPETSCETFRECMSVIRIWSDAHPGHHPIFVQVEPKTMFPDGERGVAQYDALDREIRQVFDDELLITPAFVQGDAPTLQQAVTTTGWPTLGETRGRVAFFLNCGRNDCIRYGNLDNRAAFADGNEDDAWTAIRILNNPLEGVREAVEAGYIVRTRAADNSEVVDGDEAVLMESLEIAIASGAQIISTDLPAPIPGLTYFVELPGGSPSVCNPITAPASCTSADIEDPARIVP